MPAERGFVYVIEATRGIKIGWTANPSERFRKLEDELGEYVYVWAVLPGSVADERRAHERWARLSIGGEWFENDLTLITAVERGELFGRAGLCRFSRTGVAA